MADHGRRGVLKGAAAAVGSGAAQVRWDTAPKEFDGQAGAGRPNAALARSNLARAQCFGTRFGCYRRCARHRTCYRDGAPASPGAKPGRPSFGSHLVPLEPRLLPAFKHSALS